MKILLRGHLTVPPTNRRRLRRLVEFLIARAHRPSCESWAEVSVILTDNNRIRQAKRVAFGVDEPTDVICLSYTPLPGEKPPGLRGEILVNAQRALQIGPRYGGPDRELALYIAHGLNHLAGEHDHTPAARRRMRRRENAWLRAAACEGLLSGLIPPSLRRRRRPRC